MSSLKRVKINYCNARLQDKPTFGPIILSVKNAPYAIIGTLKGTVIKIPLIFGASKEYRNEYESIDLSKNNTINLKELFLDQETASSVVGICHIDNDVIIAALMDGKVYLISENNTKLIFESESTLSTSPSVYDSDGTKHIIVSTTEGTIYIIDLSGNVISKENIGSVITAKPTFSDKSKMFVSGNDKGDVFCHSFNADMKSLSKKWEFKAGKSITTEIFSSELMKDGRLFHIFGSADKNLYCLSQDGAMAWRFPTLGKIISGIYVDDINNDGINEVVFGSCDDKVYVLSAYGNELWNYETDFWVAATPAVIDVDNDAFKEVFVGSYDNSLYCFSPEADFVPEFFSGASGIVQQSSSFEHTDIESSAGYFAKKLFQEQMDGMVIGVQAHESMKILAAVTNKGEFRSYKFDAN